MNNNILHTKFYLLLVERFLWKALLKEIIRFENTIFNPFGGNFRFSIVHNWLTKHPFQSNQITVVWRIYRGKGFVLGLIGKDALLASYGRLKMPFCPLSLPNRTPIGARSYANWGTIGTQLAPNWPSVTTNWVNWRGAILFYKITYWINHPIKSWTGSRSNWKCHFLYTILYTDLN